MAAKQDSEIQLHVLPSTSGTGCWLVCGDTGEVLALPAPMSLAYDGGDAMLVSDDPGIDLKVCTETMLQHAAFTDEGGETYVELVNDDGEKKIVWQTELANKEEWRTLKLEEGDIALKRLGLPVKGSFVWWTLRDFKECLQQSGWEAHYANEWICKSWKRWEAMAADVKVPAEHLTRSGKSRRALARLAGSAVQDSMEEYMVTTLMFLSLMCRWAISLEGKVRSCIPGLLTQIHRKALGDDPAVVYLNPDLPTVEDAWPCSLRDSSIMMSIEFGMADVEPLVSHLPDLRSALKRYRP